jgi:hypothetical protein
MVKIEKMPTQINETLTVTNDKGEQELIMWFNHAGEMYVTNDDSEDADATAFWFVIRKDDWPYIRKFIDEYLKP